MRICSVLIYYHFLLCALIFESWQFLTESPETLHKWPNQSLFMKKRSLDNLAHILVLWQTLQDFTYIPFSGFVYGIFVHLATRYTASKSFQILQASPNNRVLVGKLGLIHSWSTAERFLDLTCGSYILSLSFTCLYFWKFRNSYESLETFHKWLNQSLFMKHLSLDY